MAYRITVRSADDATNRLLGGSLYALRFIGSLDETRAIAAAVLNSWRKKPQWFGIEHLDSPARYPYTVCQDRLWYHSSGLSMRIDALA